VTIGLFVAAVVLLAAFALLESKVRSPLLPLRVVTDRNRGGVYLSLGLAIIAMFGLFLFLTYYLQVVKGYSPVQTGFAFLPMIAGMITGSTQIGARLMTRVPPRLLMAPGFLTAAIGMLILTQMQTDSSYVGLVLPAQILLGLGMGTAFMPAMSLATFGVQPRDAGVASAMVNTSQQVGGAIGTALLNTIAASAVTNWVTSHAAEAATLGKVGFANEAAVHGYATAIWWAVGILLVSAIIAVTFINTGRQSATVVSSSSEDGQEDLTTVPVMAH
jgi:predicted MFS family arabinose efflux permease